MLVKGCNSNVLCAFFVLQVVNYWAGKGISGFTVYKFRLRRLEGQPTLTTNQVYYNSLISSKTFSCFVAFCFYMKFLFIYDDVKH